MLKTEMRNPDTMHINEMSTLDMMRVMQDANKRAAESLDSQLGNIAAAIDAISERMNKGGRLFYIGCGTSGRLGVLDASECPPTYGVPHGKVVGIIAGGDSALRIASEGTEDNYELGASDLEGQSLNELDSVIGISVAGGARYVYSLINIAGSINVIDSLNVIRELIYEKKAYTPNDFLALMDARDPQFLRAAKKCISYGNDNDRADSVGTRLLADIVDTFALHECFPRGKFYPVANQFVTYVDAGRNIPATPDGRAAGEPLCDSLGAIHNNDHKGATALLNSVAKLDVRKIIGTPTTNIRLSREQVAVALPALVNAFFERGGMQLQVSCLSREDILDAMANPEKHASLVVRIGGYSEYFNRLSPALQQTVLERTEH